MKQPPFSPLSDNPNGLVHSPGGRKLRITRNAVTVCCTRTSNSVVQRSVMAPAAAVAGSSSLFFSPFVKRNRDFDHGKHTNRRRKREILTISPSNINPFVCECPLQYNLSRSRMRGEETYVNDCLPFCRVQ